MNGLTVETLEAAEARIVEALAEGFRHFMVAGEQLEAIRNSMLWAEDHLSFESYMLAVFDLKARHGYRLIAAFHIRQALCPIGHKNTPSYQMPESEGACRELVPLLPEPEKLQQAWKTAIAAAEGGPVTASKVRAAVRQITMPPASGERRDLDSLADLEWPQGVSAGGQHTAELLPVPPGDRQTVIDEAVKLADEKARSTDADPKITSSLIRKAAKSVALATEAEVPMDSPEWVRANRSAFDQLVAQATALRQGIAQLKKSPIGQYVDAADLDAQVKYVQRALRDARPHAVCPDCRGRSEDRDDCTRCNVNLDSGSGWVSRLKFRLATEDERIGLEPWS